jgi:hypothetical protein
MLEWADEVGGKSGIQQSLTDSGTNLFESHVREAVTLDPSSVEGLKAEISGAFGEYASRLG